MQDFEVRRCTRRCASTDRDLQPEEAFYSVLIEENGEVVRLDYSLGAWEGAPENAIGWWKSQMPSNDVRKLNWAPNDVMLHYFEQLEEQPTKSDVRYVLTLLMIRRRILRLEDTEIDDAGAEWMVLYCPRREAEFRVLVVDPASERIDQIQDELSQLLFGASEAK